MHKTLDWGVGRLMQRVECELGVVGKHDRLHWEELPEDRVLTGLLPVDATQNVRAVSGLVEQAYGTRNWDSSRVGC